MEKLKAAGLYGGALVPISGSLVDRYNDCLAMLGVAPTQHKSISIDGMGWSPEVSEEKKEAFYLNIGDANSNAIIVSPQQEGKPVHMPFHSFDRDVMTAIFSAYRKEIRDITKDAAICVHLDQSMDTYYEPFDLLQYKQLTVGFRLLQDLETKQKEQLQLIETFHEGNNFIDRNLHDELLDSAKKYGDLRNRKLSLEPIQLDIKSFYTRAFGGIFVLRDFASDIIVFEELEMFNKAIKNTIHEVSLYHTSHYELTAALVNYRIADFNLKKAAKTPRYERIKLHRFVSHLKQHEHPLNEILESPFLFKRYLNQLPEETQKMLLSVERYNQRKIVERDLKIDDVVDLEYTKALLEPHGDLEEEQTELIWHLLTKIVPLDPLHLYWYDKEGFYNTFPTWNESYQEWIIKYIVEQNNLSE